MVQLGVRVKIGSYVMPMANARVPVQLAQIKQPEMVRKGAHVNKGICVKGKETANVRIS